MRLVSELKRRNVPRMAVFYAVVAWLIVQVIQVLSDIAKLPDWIGITALWLLAVGFPFALIFSWFYEITPGGISLEKDVDRPDSITHVTGRRLDFLVISLLCAAVILFAYDKWWMGPPPEASIAVLPFVNMSGEPELEYFSDGISEELLNVLAKVPDLRVISRSSAFSFKDKNVAIPEIARQLNVAHILEGSVRRDGNQVRITAQLIEARSDTHLWSETYDRSLDDIFAIQDEIAAAVVAQLKIVLLDAPPVVKETDPRAYALYLQARHIRQQRSGGIEQAETLLGQALAIDPDYADALVELGIVYDYQLNGGLRTITEGLALQREAVNKALAIEPDHALALARLGWIAFVYDRNLTDAARYLEHALQLEPANTSIISNAADLMLSLGRVDEAIELAEILTSRDPVNAEAHYELGRYYNSAGQWDKAIASARTTLLLAPGLSGGQFIIGEALLLKGEAQAALEAMRLEPDIWGPIGSSMAYHALGRKEESDAALTQLIAEQEQRASYNIAYVLAYRGEADRAFEWLAKAVDYRDSGLRRITVEREFTRIHDDPRWSPFLESIGRSPEQLAAIKFEVTLPE